MQALNGASQIKTGWVGSSVFVNYKLEYIWEQEISEIYRIQNIIYRNVILTVFLVCETLSAV